MPSSVAAVVAPGFSMYTCVAPCSSAAAKSEGASHVRPAHMTGATPEPAALLARSRETERSLRRQLTAQLAEECRAGPQQIAATLVVSDPALRRAASLGDRDDAGALSRALFLYVVPWIARAHRIVGRRQTRLNVLGTAR